VTQALTQMQHPMGAASAILASVAHAMTDVTGFGLAGHLLEILRASGCGAILDVDAIPVLPGALALAAAGHASTLAPSNRAAVGGAMVADDSPRVAVLFDPQTGGGLLAAVPGDQADAVLAALREAGEAASLIGQITEGSVKIALRSR
jgi:selenide, water dikinase